MDILGRRYSIYSGFILLILLNIFDGVATYIGLNKGFYIEENFILNYIYQLSSMMFILIKIVLPTIALSILMIIVGSKTTRVIKSMIYLGNIVYTVLCIYHIGLYSLAFKLALY